MPRKLCLGTGSNGVPLHLSQFQREGHTHIIGASGKGKSKLLELLIRHDINNPGVGACVLDPHQSLIDSVLAYCAEKRPHLAKRLLVVNPLEGDQRTVGFNPLAGVNDENVDYFVSSIVEAILKACGQSNMMDTPRVTSMLTAIFEVIAHRRLTMIEAVPFLSITPNSAHSALLRSMESDLLRTSWGTFEGMNQKQKQEYVEGPANRLIHFMKNEHIRNMIGQRERVIDFGAAMEQGKIILVNLRGGEKIGQRGTDLLGAMMVNEIVRVAMLRNPNDSKKKPFFLYIDEFNRFVTEGIAKALDECRKFGLYLTLAHQHLSQLRRDSDLVCASVMTNCSNRFVFGGLMQEDAEILERHLYTGFDDFKQLKDEITATRTRSIEEMRKVTITSETDEVSEIHGLNMGTTEREATGTATRDSTSSSSEHTSGSSKQNQQQHSQTGTRSASYTEGKENGIERIVRDGQAYTESFSDGYTHGASHTYGASQASSQFASHEAQEQLSQSRERGQRQEQFQRHEDSSQHQTREADSANSTHGEQSTTSGLQRDIRSVSSDGTSRQSSQMQSRAFGSNSATGMQHATESRDAEEIRQSRNSSQGQKQEAQKTNTQAETANTSFTANRSVSQNRGKESAQREGEKSSKSRSETDAETLARHEATLESISQTDRQGRQQAREQHEQCVQEHMKQRQEQFNQAQRKTRTTTEAPHNRQEEYQEVTSRSHYSLPEIIMMNTGNLRNLRSGEVMVQFDRSEPQKVAVEHIRDIRDTGRISENRRARLIEKIVRQNPSVYQTEREAVRSWKTTQERILGYSINFGSPSEKRADFSSQNSEKYSFFDDEDGPFS